MFTGQGGSQNPTTILDLFQIELEHAQKQSIDLMLLLDRHLIAKAWSAFAHLQPVC